MQTKLSQLRGVISAIEADERPEPERSRPRLLQPYAIEGDHPVLEQTPRARAVREISRIATYYGWGHEVSRFLDRHCVSSVPELTEDQVFELADRMCRLEQCAQHDFGWADASFAD